MTRSRPKTNADANGVSSTRRSTRNAAPPSNLKGTKTAATHKQSEASKSKVDTVDSSEGEEIEDDEGNQEETLAQISQRNASVRRTKEMRSATSIKKPAIDASKAGKAAAARVPSEDQEEEEAEDEEEAEGEEDAEDGEVEEDELEESSSSEEDDDGSDFEEPSQKRRTKAAASKKTRQPKPVESRIPIIKPRKSRTTTPKAPKTAKKAKASTSSASRKKQSAATTSDNEAEDDEEGHYAIYSAVLDSQVALETVATDWISLYQRSSNEAMLNLTNFLIRCCGCKQFLTASDFADQNEMVENLNSILLRYKETTTNFDYPIVSKAKEFKKFKKNLLEFYSRLFQKVQGDILFDGAFMNTLLNWTLSLSSSSYRPVRHTATTVALNVVTSLAEISSELQEELNVSNRQLATSQKQKAAQSKVKQLEKKVAENQRRKKEIRDWINEIFDSVYVLRCRDVDPLVRLDCVHELGEWMMVNPEQFIAQTYLGYVGWGLSDKAAAVRLEALKVLAKLYEIENQPSALRQFTPRFTDRFIGMAIGESDTSARLGAIRVVTLIHKRGQLEEADQVKLSALIFGANARVRKSLAKFIKAHVWEDEVEARIADCELLVSSAQGESKIVRKDWVELKSLANFFVKVGKEVGDENESAAQGEHLKVAGTRLFDETKIGRIALAVEALWSEVETLKNWKSIAEYLLEDHTATSASSSSSKRGNSKPASLEDVYHLEEEEENVLLEIFIASLQLTLNPPVVHGFQKDKARLKAQLDEVANEVGGYCANIMPQLFSKYGVDASRIRSVLVIPQIIPLGTYVDLRMLTAYEELVDEVIKVFKKHSDPSVLSAAALTIRTMQGNEILRTSHEAKIEALGSSVLDSFLTLLSQNQDTDVADRDMLESLTLCLRRLEHLIKFTDVTVKRIRSTDQDPFDGFLNVIQRYRQVRDQDAEVLISALSISFLWISWVCRSYASKYDQNADWTENDVQALLHMRETLIRVVSDLAIKESQDIDARVRRRAFQILGDIYWLFGGDMFHASKGTNRHRLYMTCPETTQDECERFLRSELDLWQEKVQEKMKTLRAARIPKTPSNDVAEVDGDSDREDGDNDNAANMAEILEDEKLAAAQIEQEDKYEMFGTVFSYMRQIMLRDFSMGHATPIIARYGHFGAEYDEGAKRVLTSIKMQMTEGLFRKANDQKAEAFMGICLEALKESFEIYMDGRAMSINQSLQLAKVLATAIKPPGFMQTSRVGIDSQLVWNLHRCGITYALVKIEEYGTAKDAKKQAKMIKFFDILGQIPFGSQTASNEVTSLQELIKSECESKGFAIDRDDMWEPLRSYQSKLEKQLQKAAADQAAAVKKAEAAAQLREEQLQEQQKEQQQSGQELDIEMANADTEQVEESSMSRPTTYGRKRQAEDEEEEEEEDDDRDAVAHGEEDDEFGQKEQRSRSASAIESDNEGGDLAAKGTKRIRVH
ncbi:hypothetical protein BC939DRAFT_468717 [Gamsiella multidivaricata]|uniref:uncharacterized protein n=1 Tax=Gamsiella multidivaricata TaxID=101098 RepID=UPI002220B72B|nr:uncharacterized protein BC939DRAFT_468717 [Gamsiella multidivaricata]KAI7816531.1 hypothetical protein BC939DRAFT_468717 [Gamsiella multidivaricata]